MNTNVRKRRTGWMYSIQEEREGIPASMMEWDTIQCGHCSTTVILNPDRTRPRAWCAKADHYICDTCNVALVATGICLPLEMRIDMTLHHSGLEIPFLDGVGPTGEVLIPQYLLDKEKVF